MQDSARVMAFGVLVVTLSWVYIAVFANSEEVQRAAVDGMAKGFGNGRGD